MNAVEEASSPTSPAIVVGGGLLALGFAAIAVWGFVTAEPAPAPRTPPIAAGEDVAVAVPVVAPAPVVEETDGEVMVRAKEAGPLLRVRLLDLDGDRGVRLADAFVPRTITVVNVWATWCAPCIQEFVEFNRLAAGWGDSVRFLPVEVVPSDRQKRDALVTEHRQQMPRASVQLGDLTAGAVQDALRELALPNLSELAGAGVPITLVFDCHKNLTWARFNALDEASLRELAAKLDELRGGLGRCPAAPSPAPQEASAGGPSCGDGTCEEKLGEDCRACSRDCGCPRGDKCVARDASSLQNGSAVYFCDSPSPLM